MRDAELQSALLKIAARMSTLVALGNQGRLSKLGHGELSGLNYAAECLLQKNKPRTNPAGGETRKAS